MVGVSAVVSTCVGDAACGGRAVGLTASPGEGRVACSDGCGAGRVAGCGVRDVLSCSGCPHPARNSTSSASQQKRSNVTSVMRTHVLKIVLSVPRTEAHVKKVFGQIRLAPTRVLSLARACFAAYGGTNLAA